MTTLHDFSPKTRCGVRFPMFSRIEAKFLVDRGGRLVARFGPRTEPEAPELVAALEKALG